METEQDFSKITHQAAFQYQAACIHSIANLPWAPPLLRSGLLVLVEYTFLLYFRVTGAYSHTNEKILSLINNYIKQQASQTNSQPQLTQEEADKKIAVITGGNIGIGLETAWALAKAGFRVILACRDEGRANSALDEIISREPNASVQFIRLDLTSLDSVRQFTLEFTSKFSRLDLLVNNAGIMHLPKYEETCDGFEKQYQVNYLSHFLLTRLLLPVLQKTPQAKVINVSSLAHFDVGSCDFSLAESGKTTYCPARNYALSKTAMVMMTYSFQEKMGRDCDLQFYVVHPGLVATQLLRHVPLVSAFKKLDFTLIKTPAEGALTTIRVALTPSSELKSSGSTSRYYAEELPMSPYHAVNIPERRQALWLSSCNLLNLCEEL